MTALDLTQEQIEQTIEKVMKITLPSIEREKYQERRDNIIVGLQLALSLIKTNNLCYGSTMTDIDECMKENNNGQF